MGGDPEMSSGALCNNTSTMYTEGVYSTEFLHLHEAMSFRDSATTYHCSHKCGSSSYYAVEEFSAAARGRERIHSSPATKMPSSSSFDRFDSTEDPSCKSKGKDQFSAGDEKNLVQLL